ncbi:extracellular solute-binding protein [Xylanimonas allomyrinae]|uniref:Extracellular solute-binding protein n=1 Tax=Xylanimonas allomyrinae TaxID=2509459 RepID=A0A4V0YDX5_9MICO|nr:extracellular solute-binding protein [Xylanimonas allomyrinae]QAY62231.1 extracellular solute-binding protein [Xylanimonas allomyrinae]
MGSTFRVPARARKGRPIGAAVAGVAVLALAACGGGSGFDEPGQNGTGGGGALRVLIGSSGDAETQTVTQQLADWSAQSGTQANLSLATDLPQQLAQGFAAGSPPDVFYVSTEAFPGWAANGSLEPYADQLDADFYPTLKASFTFDGQFFCAPKDFSTLALIINDTAWQAAGLTAADYPKTWDDLKAVAQKLTTGTQVGLSFGPEWARVGAFMAQAGGHLLDADGSADVDTPQNLQALQFVNDLLSSGVAAKPSQIDSGWGGEAFGTQRAAMTIEGNWIVGAMQNDYPDVQYTVVPLPEGPGGPGTLQFTNCWGIAADSRNKEAAIDLVKFLVSDEQQMAAAKGFGVMPSVESVADEWAKEFPEQQAFVDGAQHAQGVPPVQGWTEVVGDFNAQLEGLPNADPQSILTSVQGSLEAIAP